MRAKKSRAFHTATQGYRAHSLAVAAAQKKSGKDSNPTNWEHHGTDPMFVATLPPN